MSTGISRFPHSDRRMLVWRTRIPGIGSFSFRCRTGHHDPPLYLPICRLASESVGEHLDRILTCNTHSKAPEVLCARQALDPERDRVAGDRDAERLELFGDLAGEPH